MWAFSARIVSALAPSLINRDTIEITSLEIASIGIDNARIRRLAGRILVPAGTVSFDIENTTVSYDLRRLRAGKTRIGLANIAYHPITDAETVPAEAAPIALPPQVSMDRLHFIYDDRFDFVGRFDFAGSGDSFTIDAVDERAHLTLRGDTAFSAFDLTLAVPDRGRIAEGRIDFVESGLTGFNLALRLEPALEWLRTWDILPAATSEQLNEIDSASGKLWLDGRQDDGRWELEFDLDLQRLAAGSFYSRGTLAGALRPGDHGWTLTLSRAGDLQITTIDGALADVYSFNAVLPQGYAVSQVMTDAGLGTLAGSGAATVAFYHSGDLELEALMTRWSVRDLQRAHVELSGVQVANPIELSMEDLIVDISLVHTQPLRASGDVELSGVKTGAWLPGVGAADLRGEWEWSDGSFEMNGTANLGGPPDVNWNLSSRYNMGEVRVDLDTRLPDLVKPFNDYIKYNHVDLELLDGSVKGLLKWTWDNDRYDNQLALQASGGRGRFMGLEFEGASLDVASSDLVAPTLRLEGQFPYVNLANDIDVSDISVSGRWQSGFHLDKAKMSVLGGEVKINPFFLDRDDPVLDAELEVRELDLEQILQMVDQSGLTGSGRLSGTIPIRVKEAAVAIDDGRLTNTTEGRISYNIGDVATAQINNIAVQALQDFRYDLLDVNLNYQFDGDYSIRARIEGRNPSLYDGYPVAFNLNLTGTLPGLLRASLISGNFHSEILRQIQLQR